jgi:hypothetical protein
MKNLSHTLHLVIPGLLNFPFLRFPDVSVPSLEWLLSRAKVNTASTAIDNILFDVFGLPVLPDADLPIASITRLIDRSGTDGGWWMRADPVHFRTDLHSVFLIDARSLAIEHEEAQDLTAAFNQIFIDSELQQIEALQPQRRYLRLANDPRIRTFSLGTVTGRDIRNFLPYGPDKQRWHKLFTEVQMLFNTHSVNKLREEHKKPLINGIWFWGGGTCPTSVRAPVARVYAEDPLSCGLARISGLSISTVPLSANDWLATVDSSMDSIIVLETTRYDSINGDVELWANHVESLEDEWFTDCLQWIKNGQLAALNIYPDNGKIYSVTSPARWYFWQYPKPLFDYLH